MWMLNLRLVEKYDSDSLKVTSCVDAVALTNVELNPVYQ